MPKLKRFPRDLFTEFTTVYYQVIRFVIFIRVAFLFFLILGHFVTDCGHQSTLTTFKVDFETVSIYKK